MASSIVEFAETVTYESFGGNEVERLRVRAAARQLLARIETPYEQAWGFCFEQPVVSAALQTCIDLDLWKAWTLAGGGERSIDELVKMCNHEVEPNLLRACLLLPSSLLRWVLTSELSGRLFRLLSAFNVVKETGEDRFEPTAFSLAIGDESTKVRASLEAG